MTRPELIRKLGLTQEEFRDVLVRRTAKEEVKPRNTSNNVIREYSIEDYFSKVRSSYVDNKKLDKHHFKNKPDIIHITEAISRLEKKTLTSKDILNAARDLYYAWYVNQVGVRERTSKEKV